MTLTVGFIGVGSIATIHLKNLTAHSDVTVRAVMDIDEEAAQAVADTHGAVVYTDGAELITSESLDALFVAVPPFAHGDYETLAAERGIDLFVEKPLGLSMESVQERQATIERAGVLTQVGYVCRYADITDKARELLEGRQVGTIDSTYWVSPPPTRWWRKRSKSGGQLVEQSTHVFDVHRYLAGEVSSVMGSGTDQLLCEEIDFEDFTSITLRHESGAVTHISSTCATSQASFEVTIIAEDLQITLDYLNHSLTGTVDGNAISYEGGATWYERELASFLDAVHDGSNDSIRSDYLDATKTLRLTLAAQRTVDTAERVEL